MRIRNYAELFSILPEEERIIVDVLREIIIETLPSYCKEKISYNVPFFYGKKGICIIWPSTVPRGGIKQGVLLGFWYGSKLQDAANYLTRGTNKRIYYRVYLSPTEININDVSRLLKEAADLDQKW
ncbi:DUF1801 domain-containing protein [Paradesertivirga mongoliensis]|uniref:DUF1801 domain-containing protein n=1 Tax=Paradesertivirga mongoliensis TaxID=2100740 RepID=A0ABW4ZLU2_9SPHI|nr:DUF1801 domain-containing protein [Pedobacter mongoliensis]